MSRAIFQDEHRISETLLIIILCVSILLILFGIAQLIRYMRKCYDRSRETKLEESWTLNGRQPEFGRAGKGCFMGQGTAWSDCIILSFYQENRFLEKGFFQQECEGSNTFDELYSRLEFCYMEVSSAFLPDLRDFDQY